MTALIILILLLCGFFTGILSYKSFSIKKTVISVYPILIMIIAAIYYKIHGLSVTFWVGIVLNMVFLYFSTGDILTRKVHDVMHILVFISGAVLISKERLSSMIAGFLLLGLIPLVAAVIKPGCFGGADIKILAVLGWLFGLRNGVLVMIIGLILSIIGTVVVSFAKQHKIKNIPMVPYFCVAASVVFLTLTKC